MTLPKASHFFLANDRWLGIAYERLSLEELQKSMAALERIQNVDVQLPSEQKEGSVILVAIRKTDNFRDVIRAIREVVQPKLPFLLAKLGLEFNRCRQNLHNQAGAFPAFMPGFEPEDLQVFMHSFYARAGEVIVSQFIPVDGSTDLYPLLVNVFHKLLEGLKVNVHETEFKVSFCC